MSNYIEWFPPDGVGETIQFTTEYEAPYKLVAVQGLEPVSVQPVAIKSPSQAGETALDLVVPPRVVVVQGLLQAVSMTDLWPLRRALSRSCVAQPVRYNEDMVLGRLRLVRDGQDILELDAVVLSSKFPQPKNNVGVVGFDIEFYSPSPYWREIEDETATMSGSGGFEYPLVFTEEFPGGSVTAEVDNVGDVDAPVVIRLFGEATNPRLTNDTTGEIVQITGSFTSDEYVEVNTGFGVKSVELVTISTGDRVSIFDQLDPDSDLWTLRPGINNLTFDADAIVTGYADVRWRERYAGV